jgi:nucleoside-diphosphate-sugar epimerase
LLHALRDARPDLIFHSAAILSAFAEERPQAAYRTNATGTYNVLEAALVLGIARVMFTSTIATYGPGAALTVDETTRQRPTTMYGVTKAFGEMLGEYYAARFGLDFRAVRLPSVIGPGRGPGGASAYTSLVVSEPARRRSYVVPVPESTVTPLLYVKDAVAALTGLAAADATRLRRRTYGVNGFSPTARELADAVCRSIPDARIDFAPVPSIAAIVDTWPERVDDSEAVADWGWLAGYDLDSAVTDFTADTIAKPAWP